MNRSAVGYPFGRAFEGEAGGPAELQTDVMRFMAILSLCLVAIFALVQSLPMPPPEPPPEQMPVKDRSSPRLADPPPTSTVVNDEPPNERKADVPPAAPPRPSPVAPPPSQQNLLASIAAPMPTPASAPTFPSPPQPEGFVLRFESDSALFELVESERVGLFAMQNGLVKRLSVTQESAAFWPASQPRQYYEMDQATVPSSVVTALRSAAGRVVWGVTLPNDTRAELGRYLREERGGSLIIDRNGRLRLEP